VATLDLIAPGASPSDVMRGLAAAGDIVRTSGLSPEVLRAAKFAVEQQGADRLALPDGSWHFRAAALFDEAQAAAMAACFGGRPPSEGSHLAIVDSKGPSSFL
jgi:hypothetical protein